MRSHLLLRNLQYFTVVYLGTVLRIMLCFISSFVSDRYWYENGCMFPDMGTTWLAIDKATKENGCLKVSDGRHTVDEKP